MAMLLALALTADGPIGKFDGKQPEFEGTSSSALFDIERCMIDLPGKIAAPLVYRQPDLPDRVTLLWTDKGRGIWRIDLARSGDATKVRAWRSRSSIESCL